MIRQDANRGERDGSGPGGRICSVNGQEQVHCINAVVRLFRWCKVEFHSGRSEWREAETGMLSAMPTESSAASSEADYQKLPQSEWG
jgi:hypothetical protein